VQPRELEEVLRLEYRSKLLNPKARRMADAAHASPLSMISAACTVRTPSQPAHSGAVCLSLSA